MNGFFLFGKIILQLSYWYTTFSCRHATATELKVILGVFVHRGLSVIEELMLEENFLPELSPEIFENSPQIHRFFLWNNGIQHVANNSLDPLSLGLRELHIREPHLIDIPRYLFISMVEYFKNNSISCCLIVNLWNRHNYRSWQWKIPLSLNSLKLTFVIRWYVCRICVVNM